MGVKKRLAMQTVQKNIYLIYGILLKISSLFCIMCINPRRCAGLKSGSRFFAALTKGILQKGLDSTMTAATIILAGRQAGD